MNDLLRVARVAKLDFDIEQDEANLLEFDRKSMSREHSSTTLNRGLTPPLADMPSGPQAVSAANNKRTAENLLGRLERVRSREKRRSDPNGPCTPRNDAVEEALGWEHDPSARHEADYMEKQ